MTTGERERERKKSKPKTSSFFFLPSFVFRFRYIVSPPSPYSISFRHAPEAPLDDLRSFTPRYLRQIITGTRSFLVGTRGCQKRTSVDSQLCELGRQHLDLALFL